MLHLTFVNDFTVSNNSFQNNTYPIKTSTPSFENQIPRIFFLFLLLSNFSDDPFIQTPL